ncbi:MAG: hypothetical protein QOE24_2082 [Frankiales bacterium]|nr:hypothetical protein [Frankiales bacterium]
MGAPTMSRSMFTLFAVAALVPLGMWCSLRAAAAADLTLLPASSLRRLRSWQKNAHHVYLGSASLALGVGLFAVLRLAL